MNLRKNSMYLITTITVIEKNIILIDSLFLHVYSEPSVFYRKEITEENYFDLWIKSYR